MIQEHIKYCPLYKCTRYDLLFGSCEDVLTYENIIVKMCSFFQKCGIVDSLCFPYIRGTALQVCVIGNVQDHRAGVQMLMCINVQGLV